MVNSSIDSEKKKKIAGDSIPPVHDVLILNSCVASQVKLAQVEKCKGQIGHHEGETQKRVWRCATF